MRWAQTLPERNTRGKSETSTPKILQNTSTPLILHKYSADTPTVLQKYSNFFLEYRESRFSPLEETSSPTKLKDLLQPILIPLQKILLYRVKYWKQINAFEANNKWSKDRPKYEQKLCINKKNTFLLKIYLVWWITICDCSTTLWSYFGRSNHRYRYSMGLSNRTSCWTSIWLG